MTTISEAIKEEYTKKFQGFKAGTHIDASENIKDAISKNVDEAMQSTKEIEGFLLDGVDPDYIKEKISNIEAFDDDDATRLNPTDINLMTLAVLSLMIETEGDRQQRMMQEEILENRIESSLY